jgi:drug/metabolite transporter (DMT)-like permease
MLAGLVARPRCWRWKATPASEPLFFEPLLFFDCNSLTHSTAPSPAAITADAASTSKPWLADFILLGALWGSSFLFMRLSAPEFGVLPTAGLRVLIAALALLALTFSRGLGGSLRQHWRKTCLIGVLNSAIPFVCFAYAILYITTGLTAILNATVPLFGAVIAWAWLKDRPGIWRVLGLGIGFVGVTMLAWQKASFKPDAAGVTTGWAVLACLLATLCYGLAASCAKRYLTGLPSLVTATGSQCGAALALTLPTVWLWPAGSPSLKAWLAVLALGLLCTGLAYILYFRLIERAGPARTVAVTFLIPCFAVIYGVLLLGEEVTPWMMFCGTIIICGTALATGVVGPRKAA